MRGAAYLALLGGRICHSSKKVVPPSNAGQPASLDDPQKCIKSLSDPVKSTSLSHLLAWHEHTFSRRSSWWRSPFLALKRSLSTLCLLKTRLLSSRGAPAHLCLKLLLSDREEITRRLLWGSRTPPAMCTSCMPVPTRYAFSSQLSSVLSNITTKS